MGLSFKEKYSFGIGALGKDLCYAIVSSYLMIHNTNSSLTHLLNCCLYIVISCIFSLSLISSHSFSFIPFQVCASLRSS